MSISNIRRSVLILAGAGALALGGLLAGRLAANVLPGGSRSGAFGPPRFARIAGELELTEDQKARIKEILRARAPEIEAQLKAGREARHSLHDAMMADPVDEPAIRARAAELSGVESQGAVLFAQVRAQIFPLLTEDQQQKVAQWRGRMRARGDRAARGLEEFLSDAEP